MKCTYLEGENLKPNSAKEARALIGKRIKYLNVDDVDKTGRGYFFPKYGTVVAVSGRNIAIDYENNFITSISRILELIVLTH